MTKLPIHPTLSSVPSEYSGNSAWAVASHRDRCRTVARTAAEIIDVADTLVRLCQSEQRTAAVETIASELIPLCDGLVWIGRKGPRVLADRKLSRWSRPLWLWGVHSRVRRDAFGRVLILGTWNYPLLLAGTQAAQALAAGNSVLLKPAVGCEAASAELAKCFYLAGVPQECLTVLDSSTAAATNAIDNGVDLIVLTGGASTGRKVLARAAESLTPCLMELSGCDAVIVLDGADLDRVGQAVRFGLSFNAGATCIGPRRLIVHEANADAVLKQIISPWSGSEVPTMVVHPAVRESLAAVIERAIRGGARDVLGRFDPERLRTTGQMEPTFLDGVLGTDEVAISDLFAPVLCVLRVDSLDSAASLVNDCPYRLAASVFGPSVEARKVAAKLHVGSVVINDLIVPTADPRLPFGGRGQSGFGVTRGPEGLLAMTTPTSISERRGRFAPHLRPRQDSDAETLLGSLQIQHGCGMAKRLAGLRRVIAAVKTARS